MSIVFNRSPLQAPTVGTAVASTTSFTSILVPFTQPADDGGVPILYYIATASPGGQTATVTQSGSGTITVGGLTTGQPYTFTVQAYNYFGLGPSSTNSNCASPNIPPGSQSFTTSGLFTWHPVTGTTSISVVAVGAGGSGYDTGGGGGGLGWKNNIPITTSSYTVFVGATCYPGGTSYFCNIYLVAGIGGSGGCHRHSSSCVGNGQGGSFAGDGGGRGGWGLYGYCNPAGGGGAAGYNGQCWCGSYYGCGGGASGRGGDASQACRHQGQAGYNGGGGGGGAYGGGGGVGLFGQGANGAASTAYINCTVQGGGGGGSGGCAGASGMGANGGKYGGGGATSKFGGGSGLGAVGAVRIVWPGNSRRFPSTCVGTP